MHQVERGMKKLTLMLLLALVCGGCVGRHKLRDINTVERKSEAWRGRAWRGMARHGEAWHGAAWLGMARQGKVTDT